MSVIYKIERWEEWYENNRSRTVKDLRWVLVPNGHDGESYSRLMMMKEAPIVFTVWILMLQVASRCHPRGTLLRDDKTPHDSESLAIRTRAKKEWFDIALPILTKLRWIKAEVTDCQEGDSVLSAGCHPPDEEGNGKKEGKEPTRTPSSQGSNGHLTDLDFIHQLKKNPAYVSIDVDRELSKMDAFLMTPKGRGRKKTRRFIVNWLNRIDVPVVTKIGKPFLRDVPKEDPPAFAIEGDPVTDKMIRRKVYNMAGECGVIKNIIYDDRTVMVFWFDRKVTIPVEPCRLFWSPIQKELKK